MRKVNYQRIIQHITINKHSSHPLISRLSQLCASPITSIEPQDLLEALNRFQNRILLFDYEEALELFQQVEELPLINNDFETIIINVPHQLTTELLLRFGHSKGLFYRSQSQEETAQGLDDVINGELRLPNEVCRQLLYHYRHMAKSILPQTLISLSGRQIEILSILKSGATNLQIAEQLCISESTVKSHLYQIFKKLSVKSRVQAIAWANQNLL
ncbi:LuxR C-terminal-related transcriptional regulator [Vibrio hippocampi]|uniref:HTH luxR-type domain-containing protein n=1 Tax=Vibrio hippocampi TaxID=654686 RepID=A0ABM8ZKC7_9VIBR|nr:LuxR C-terminal-related transcriptional regulator [Vibrio hippocampi]CAH0526883.1 hypothetical protein VHP8226_02259 [Vibrio hippocampi]